MIVNAGMGEYDRNNSPRYFPAYDVRKPTLDEQRIQRLIVLLQMTYMGAPMVYYGDEVGMWGADDPDDRKPMVWPDTAYEPESHHPLGKPRTPDPVVFDSTLFRFYQRAIKLRREHPAFYEGTYVGLESHHGDILAFARVKDEEIFIVL